MGRTLLTAVVVISLGTRGHDEHLAKLAAVGQAFQRAFPAGHCGDLVNEQPLHAGIRPERREEGGDLSFQIIFVGDVVAVEEVRGPRTVLSQCVPESELEPCALAVLTGTANQKDARLCRQLVEAKREAKRARLVLVLRYLRPEVDSVDFSRGKQPIPCINVHNVNSINVPEVNVKMDGFDAGAPRAGPPLRSALPRDVLEPSYPTSTAGSFEE